MDLRQEVKLEQRLRLTLQLQQAIKLLQLSRLELQETIQQEVNENPVLEQEFQDVSLTPMTDQPEARELSDAPLAPTGVDRMVPREEDEQSLRNLVEQYQSFSTTVSGASRPRDEELPAIETRVSGTPTLFEHLEWQVNMSSLDGRRKRVALAILEVVNPDGYVDLESLREIAAREAASEEELAEVLYVIQQFEPAGIASVTLTECLLAQARAYFPDRPKLHALIEEHLDELERQDYRAIQKALGVSADELRALVKLLTTLDPHPGLQFSNEEPQYVIPDVYIRKDGDHYVVELNDDGLPRLRISPVYRRLLDGRARGEEKEYLQKKLRQARWLIQSIQQRQSTIRRVAEKIVELQVDFLDHGVDHLHPMVLRDIASAIGVHESTVSRVTSNKFVHTPRGIFELKFFFGHRIAGVDGEDHSQPHIKRILKDMLAAESHEHPLSDQAIKDRLLAEHRIDLARRTITKYREEMGIPSSSVRRRRL
jgi:RNA polymerase sigma-54 factor